MCGLVVKGKTLIKRLWTELNEQSFYEIKNGNQRTWITHDELMKRNIERHFYQNLIGEIKHENIERSFKRTSRKN